MTTFCSAPCLRQESSSCVFKEALTGNSVSCSRLAAKLVLDILGETHAPMEREKPRLLSGWGSLHEHLP